MEVGFIGLGRMGGAMARRLLAHGYSVAVYDRDANQTQPLVELGASIADSIAELCRGRALVVTMLPDDTLLAEVTLGAAGLCESMEVGAIHMVSGTHGGAAIGRLTSAHVQRGKCSFPVRYWVDRTTRPRANWG